MLNSSLLMPPKKTSHPAEKVLHDSVLRKAGAVYRAIRPALEKGLLSDPNRGKPADRFERGSLLQQALFHLAAAASIQTDDQDLIETCLKIWRAPLAWERWQPAGWSVLEDSSAAEIEDGEGPGTASVISMLALCEPFLRRWLTKDDTDRMYRRIGEHCERIREDIYTGRSWFFGGPEGEDIPIGNPFTSVTVSLLLGALLFDGMDERAAEWRSLATDLLIRSMKETGEDGSYFGGVGDALSVLAESFLASAVLARRGDTRLTETPLLQNAPWWLLDTTLPDRKAWLPFHFNHAVSTKDNLLCQRIFLMALAQQPNNILNWYLHEVLGGPSPDIFGLAFYQPGLPQEEPTANETLLLMLPHINWMRTSPNRLLLPNLRTEAAHSDRKVAHYPMQGVIVYRSGFGMQDSLVAFKGGWIARGPDHFDRNSLLFYDGARPVIVEAAGSAEGNLDGTSDARKFSAHNTLQIDDNDLAGETVKISGHEWVWIEEDGKLSIKGDAGASYPQILRFLRTVQIEEAEGKVNRLIISDEILPADNREHRAILWFHTPAESYLEGDGVIIPAENSRWRLSIHEIDNPLQSPVQFNWQEEPHGEKFDPIAFTARGMIPPTGVRIVFHLERWNSKSKSY